MLDMDTLDTRAGNEPSRRLKFLNHKEGPYLGLLLVVKAPIYFTMPLQHSVLNMKSLLVILISCDCETSIFAKVGLQL